MGELLWEGRRWWDLQKLQAGEKCEGDWEKWKWYSSQQDRDDKMTSVLDICARLGIQCAEASLEESRNVPEVSYSQC